MHVADKNPPAQKGAGRDDDRAGAVLRAEAGGEQKAVPVARKIGDFRLIEREVLGGFQPPLHVPAVGAAVDLGAQGMNRRPLAAVEHAGLQHIGVGRHPHLAAERVDLPHQVPLGGAADAGIAGHIAHRVEIDGEHGGFAPQPRGGERRLDAGVSRPDDRHFIIGCQKFHAVASCR